MLLTLIIFLLILSLLVLVHELGHFLTAKKAGIKVEEFGFGLPPRIFGKKIGETIYSLNLLPIGGFVKLYGEDGENQPQKTTSFEAKRAFFAKSKKVRAAVLLAGVLMNAFLAIIAFYLFLGLSNFKTEIPLFFNYRFFGVSQEIKNEIIITKVSLNSPAEKAGIKVSSKVLQVENQEIKKMEDLSKVIGQNKGKEILFKLQDLEKKTFYEILATPRLLPPEGEGALGIGFADLQKAVLEYKTFPQKLFSGITYTFNMLFYNLAVLGNLILISLAQKTAGPVSEAVSGPVGIFAIFSQILKLGDLKLIFLQILNFLGFISISLAFFNFLPIPALDGGRLLFIGIEAFLGKKIKASTEMLFHQAGMLLLLLLIFLVTINDILRMVKK